MCDKPVVEWDEDDVKDWLTREKFTHDVISTLSGHGINGKCLLTLNENDFSTYPLNALSLGNRKCLQLTVKLLQRENQNILMDFGLTDMPLSTLYVHNHYTKPELSEYFESDRVSPSVSEDGRTSKLPPDIWKAFLSLCYVVAVTWLTAFVMVIVHDRVPDMKKYPPLPDIFLDNVPYIPWAFDMCEVTGTFLFTIWLLVLLFHKHRFILMRRFFALSGTVFLLRCVTMLITSLSVPGTHLQCEPRQYSNEMSAFTNLAFKISQAYMIWRGAGMSIQGVRTCGDYMFSGHTVALTMLNFFITEYTPRNLYFLHTATWIMNMFGVFFILAAHEHYSIDVFIAFYITSRLFLYYHTLSNNQALMQRDSNRTRVWFPLFSYFEASVDGIVPNDFDNLSEIATKLIGFFKSKFSAVVNYQMLVPSPNNNNTTNSLTSHNTSTHSDIKNK